MIRKYDRKYEKKFGKQSIYNTYIIINIIDF